MHLMRLEAQLHSVDMGEFPNMTDFAAIANLNTSGANCLIFSTLFCVSTIN